MKLFGDELGLFWETPIFSRSHSRIPINYVFPETDWKPPTELPSLAGVKLLSIDVETRDEKLKELGPGVRRGGYIVGRSIGTDDGRRWYFPTRHEGGGNMDPDLVARWQAEELNKFDGEIVGAKLDYDLDFFAEEGITFPNVKGFHDIQIAEPLIDEWRFSYSLNSIAEDYLGEGKVEEELWDISAKYGWRKEVDIKQNLWRMHSSCVGPYAIGDVDLPLRILPLQIKKLEAEQQLEVYNLERALIPILVSMRRRGIRVDIDNVDQLRSRLIQERNKWLNELKRIAGPQAELRSVNSFSKALKDRGFRLSYTPKSGQPSITSAWLRENIDDEMANAIYQGRRIDIIIRTFIDGHIINNSINGRIHCTFNQLKRESDVGNTVGTIARLSSQDPNMQNIPARDEEIGPLIRGLFLPEKDENWASQDQSQIEWRYLTHFGVGTGAEEARQAYCNNPSTDFHALTGDLLGVNAYDSFARKRVKNTNFCKVYGGGIAQLARTFGSTEEEAQRFSDRYDRDLPFVKETYKRADYWGQRQGFVSTILGRRQRFPFWEKNEFGSHSTPMTYEEAYRTFGGRIKRAWTYKALNRKLQGSGADHSKKSIVDCDKAGIYKILGPPLLTLHDELDLSVPNSKIGREAAAEAKYITENCIKLKVPVIVNVKSGINWGECI